MLDCYANDINLSKASIQNKQGEYILPTIDSITKSANYDLPKDARTFIVGSNVPGSYLSPHLAGLLSTKNKPIISVQKNKQKN